jgi:carboxyl-terminal processing protease
MKRFLLLMMMSVLASCYLFAQTNQFVAAYDNMHLQFSKSYPFGKWKAIDWNALDAKIRPKIVASGAVDDTMAFYLALKEYAVSIPDGHVSLKGWASRKAAAMYQQVGGSYGFAVTRLDDGRIVIILVNPGSPAAIAGVSFGAEVLEINDQPVQAVLDTLMVLWGETNSATLECKKMHQYRFIGRAPVGNSMKIKFRNRGAADPVIATLTAVDDNYATYNQTSMTPLDPGPVVTSRILQPGGYGYLKLTMEHGEDSAAVRQIFTSFRDAISGFISQGVRGMVLDMRVNAGGDDALAAAFSGFFYSDTSFYEYQTWYNPTDDSIEIWPSPIPHYDPVTMRGYINPNYPVGSIFIEPQGITFTKPVMVLVSPRNISTGEGIPMALQKLPGCKVVGFHGTNGSFGMVEYKIYIAPPPEELYLRYPYGQSVNKDFIIQIEGDSTLSGGVIPDLRVPMNDTVIDQLYTDSIDVELKYAIGKLNSMLGINENQPGGSGLELDPVIPNPVRSMASITYRLQEPAEVTLALYDICGKQIKTLVAERQKSGSHTVTWSSEGIYPGLYLYHLTAGGVSQTRKFIVQ